jgi:Phasin protein
MAVQRARSTYSDQSNKLTSNLASRESEFLVAPGAEIMLSTVVEGQREMLSFVAMRLEKDSDFIRQATACRNWPDILAVQSRFVQEMLRDYSSEATKMLAICSNNVVARHD